MRNPLFGWCAGLCFCLLAAPALSFAAASQSIPEPTGLLVDQTGALSDAEREALQSRLQSLQASGRAQIGVLISGGIEGEPLADYALRVAESWKLGRAGRDDGLLIVVIPSAAAARIEVGYGLEGAIPDARASRWLDDLLPAVKNNELASGLDRLLDQIDTALPLAAAKTESSEERYLFPDHPEWRMPFVLAVFSPFALFPLFFGRWGCVASGPLLAAFLGGAAWSLWGATAGLAVGGFALPLPFLWALNYATDEALGRWLQWGKAFGNVMAVAMFFSVITLFVGAGLSASEVEVWAAPVVAGLLSTGLAVFLFPGKLADFLMVVLRSAMHFVFILVVVYAALGAFIPDPGRIAFTAAATVTALAAIGLYMDSRERGRSGRANVPAGIRWSLVFFGLAMLVTLPFALLALVLAAGGDDIRTQLVQAAAGSGSIAGVLALAARVGLIAAIRVGLGGAFGGGGAGRSG